jgi:carbonic anhydrase
LTRRGWKSVVAGVGRIRRHTLVPGDAPIYGYIYDVKTGKLNELAKASEVGKAG